MEEKHILQKKKSETAKKWVCLVCGYVHYGPKPPDFCPVCGVPASEFVRKE